jgi:hypothetical protein
LGARSRPQRSSLAQQEQEAEAAPWLQAAAASCSNARLLKVLEKKYEKNKII